MKQNKFFYTEIYAFKRKPKKNVDAVYVCV